jgi:hypothetical protein
MTIPLDRLYHYIECIARKLHNDVIIYRFWPHGSKKISDLTELKFTDTYDIACSPHVYCNDQEPLNFDYYQIAAGNHYSLIKKYNLTFSLNFKKVLNIFDQCVLLHSEKGGQNLEKYRATLNFIPAYYWSHAILARDWFRYAEHTTQHKQVNKTFLVYNRAWSGSREYRLKFIDLLIDRELVVHCKTSVNAVEPELGIHYNFHQFNNPVWKPVHILENYLSETSASASTSADFDMKDYESTEIEVVLETLFDDDRCHLTEKILRPIACGQPFILVATQGSLEYLRSYGFQTFDNIWNEAYDCVSDPLTRLTDITKLMYEISQWDTKTQNKKLAQAREIANYNRELFFSQKFFNQIVSELQHNLHSALSQVVNTNSSKNFLERIKQWLAVPEIKNKFENDLSAQEIKRIINQSKLYHDRLS